MNEKFNNREMQSLFLQDFSYYQYKIKAFAHYLKGLSHEIDLAFDDMHCQF
jgi:hypothetical protein